MEKKDSLEKIWKHGRTELEKEAVPGYEELIKSTGRRLNLNKFVILVYLGTYLAMLVATIILEILNLKVYSGNTLMISLHVAVLAVAIAFAGYGIYLWVRIRKVHRPDQDLSAMIRNQIRFYRISYEIWIWMIAFTVLMASFALNTFTDNDNGTYRINNPVKYVAIMVGIFIFIYVMIKLAHYPLLKELRVRLADLSNQTTESTDRFENSRKRWRPWAVAALVVVAVGMVYLLILGLVRYSEVL